MESVNFKLVKGGNNIIQNNKFQRGQEWGKESTKLAGQNKIRQQNTELL